MSSLPLALSLTSSFTKVGAIAGLAALVGIAMLSLLAFAQAREIKRLREWAGRAPERASELEQRVSAEAAARLQRSGQPAPPVGARVIPRKTPLVSAPVSTAVNATVASVVAPGGSIAGQAAPGGTPTPGTPRPGGPLTVGEPVPGGTPTPGQTGPGQAPPGGQPIPGVATPGGQLTPAVAGQVAAEGAREGAAAAGVVAASANGEPVSAVGQASPVAPVGAAGDPVGSIAEPAQALGESREGTELEGSPAPATAAARAGSAPVRPSLPPSPSAPAPPGAPAPSVSPAAALPASVAASAAAQSPRAGSRPPAPVAAARGMPSRAVAGSAPGGAPARAPAPRASRPTPVSAGGISTRVPESPLGANGPKYFKPERSAGRTTAMVVGGVIVVALLLVLAVTELKGGGKSNAGGAPSLPAEKTHSTSHTRTPAVASSPSKTAVVVLNGTSTVGLAHHLADDLQQSGYTKAEASAAVPPGTHAITVVQYANGERADGQAVAKVLDVTHVQPMEASTASLVGSATVVVLAGADQATQFGGGGAQSTGEPAAGGGTGEASTGAGAAGTGEAGTGAGGAAGEGTAGSGQ